MKLNIFYSMNNVFILILGFISSDEEWWKFWVFNRQKYSIIFVSKQFRYAYQSFLQYLVYCNWCTPGLFRAERQLSFTFYSSLSFLPLFLSLSNPLYWCFCNLFFTAMVYWLAEHTSTAILYPDFYFCSGFCLLVCLLLCCFVVVLLSLLKTQYLDFNFNYPYLGN